MCRESVGEVKLGGYKPEYHQKSKLSASPSQLRCWEGVTGARRGLTCVPLAVTNVQMPEWETETRCDGVVFVCLMVLMLLPAPTSAPVIVHFL